MNLLTDTPATTIRVFILALICSMRIEAQVTFQATPLISMPATPQKLAKGDFNNDGRMDFVGVNFNSLANQQVAILLNSGSGTFTGSNKRYFASRQNTLGVAVGDFNEDGNLDVVTISQENTNAFSLLLGDGAGNLAAPVFFNAGNTPQGIAVGDMNKDGNLDVLVTNRGTPSDVYVYLGNGLGNFSTPTIITIPNVWDITIADFNNDANPDFAVYVGNTVQVWFGNGSGTAYTLGSTITSFGISGNPVISADLDGDGDMDILAASGYTLNDGSGNFAPRIILSQTGSVYSVADLNNDSHPDIIANDNNQNTPNMRILLGDGSGTFTLLAKFEIRGYANGIEVADVNNDGNPDVVSIGAWGGVPVADVLLGDGTGYFTNAPVKYPTITDPRDIVKGDFNEDGEIDFALTHASNIVTIYLGQGNGRFTKTPTNYATGALPQHVLTFDYNKDGHLDLVTLNWNGASLTVLTGAGNGTFSLLTNIPVTAMAGSRLTIADFNNDTFADLAVSGFTNNIISILTGTGTGFNTPTTIATSQNISEIKAADFTGDGNQDIIADFNNINRMVLFTGNGSGGFTESTTQYIHRGSFFLIEDINNDTHPDVIAFSNNSSGDDYFINNGSGNFTGTAMSVSLGGFPYGYEDMNGDGIKDLVVGSQNMSSSSPGQLVVFRGTAGGISNSILIDKDYSGGNRFVLHDLNKDGRMDILATSNNLYEDYVGSLINTTVAAGCPAITSQSSSASVCTGQAFSFGITASGSAPLAYQWRKDGVDMPGRTTANLTFLVVTSADAGTYSCRVSNGCGSVISNNMVLAVAPSPAAPGATGAGGCAGASLTLTASGGSNGQYRWYVMVEDEDPYGNPTFEIQLIPGQTNSTYTTPPLTETTEFLVTITNGTCESTPTPVEATITNCNGTPPVITPQVLATQSGQSITLDLIPIITVTNGSLNITSLQILVPPPSGAIATISSSGILTINYSGINFTGSEFITIGACDTNGLCAEQVFTITVHEGIEIYNAVSPNNDGKNDFFEVTNLSAVEPENTVTIYNRWGSKVFEVENYTEANAFRGINNNGNELPSGTYFYKILFKSTGKTQHGFLVLKR
ncbi:MAG: VCBS repeat-containing protein [Cyclobacteriaceae bacterium]|nr:VCBS repeat-containing protein [Cyclobacteriaceae bacterium]